MHEYIDTISKESNDHFESLSEIALFLRNKLDKIGDCRQISLAKTKLEECILWASKAIIEKDENV